MTRKAALKLSFSPDDYLVTWQLPSPEGGRFDAHGALTVEAGKSPTGIAHGDFENKLEQMSDGAISFPQIVTAPVMSGNLSTGANALLVNARVTYWFPTQARIEADAAIITLAEVSAIEEMPFQSFDIQISGLDALAGVGPIKSTKLPTMGGAGTWAAELASDFTQQWNDAGASMILTYHGSFRSFDPYAFSMGFSPVLSCKLMTPLALRQLIDDWIDPLRRVVSVGTGRAEDITYLTVYPVTPQGTEQKGQLFGSGITQEPYESSREEIDKIKAPLRLKPDQVSLLELLRAWQKLAGVHHPLLETYGSMLHTRDQHPRSRFLLLLQAIEGTHGHETRAAFARRQKKHTEDRDSVMELAQQVLDGRQVRFLDRNLGKRPPGGLEPSVDWLAKRLPGAWVAQLEATPLIATAKNPPTNARSASDALRIIRNHLAHGTKGYDAYELHQVVKILEQMVRGHALELLGCPSAVVIRALNEP